MGRRDFFGLPSLLCDILRATSHQRRAMPTGKYVKERVNLLKEISKEGIEKLIACGLIKNTNEGFINPKRNQKIGYYRTKGAGGKRYIEDWFANKVKN